MTIMVAVLGFLFLLDILRTGHGDQVLDDVMPGVVYVVCFVVFWSGAAVLTTVAVLAFRRRRVSKEKRSPERRP